MTLRAISIIPFAFAALPVLFPAAGCGGARVETPAPGQPREPAGDDVPPPSPADVMIQDEAVPAADEETGHEPDASAAADEPIAAEVAPVKPDRALPAEDPLCRRHWEELMSAPTGSSPIDCNRVDRLDYWRWTTTGGCRSITRLVLRRGGAAVLERSGTVAKNETCGATSSIEKTIAPAATAAAIRSACEAFNREYDPGAGIGCPAGSSLLEFFDGNAKIGRTEALPCDSRAMAGARTALDRLQDRF